MGGFHHTFSLAPALPLLIFGLIVVLVIVAAIFGHMQEKKRREQLLAIARRLGLGFRERDDAMDQRYASSMRCNRAKTAMRSMCSRASTADARCRRLIITTRRIRGTQNAA